MSKQSLYCDRVFNYCLSNLNIDPNLTINIDYGTKEHPQQSHVNLVFNGATYDIYGLDYVCEKKPATFTHMTKNMRKRTINRHVVDHILDANPHLDTRLRNYVKDRPVKPLSHKRVIEPTPRDLMCAAYLYTLARMVGDYHFKALNTFLGVDVDFTRSWITKAYFYIESQKGLTKPQLPKKKADNPTTVKTVNTAAKTSATKKAVKKKTRRRATRKTQK